MGGSSTASRWLRLVAVLVASALLWTGGAAEALALAADPARPLAWQIQTGPVVGGTALETTQAAGWPLSYDRQVSPATVNTVSSGLGQALEAVPRLSGLP